MRDKNSIKEIQTNFKVRNNEKKLISFELCRNIVLQVIPTVLTIIITVMTANISDSLLNKYLFLVCVLLLAFSFFNIWNECIKNGFIEELFEFKQKEIYYKEQKEEYESILVELHKNAMWSINSLRIYATIKDYIYKLKDPNKQTFADFIGITIIKFMYDFMTHISEVGELVSVALYVYDEQYNILLDYKSKKSQMMQERKDEKGRIWPTRSESHIAHTYRSGKYRVYYDLQDMEPGVEEDFSRSYDRDYYRSSITYPIKFPNSQNVRAVFCVTSNLLGAFGPCESDKNNKIHIDKMYAIRQNYIFAICTWLEFLINTVYPSSNNEMLETSKNEYPKEYLNKFTTDFSQADKSEVP